MAVDGYNSLQYADEEGLLTFTGVKEEHPKLCDIIAKSNDDLV